MIATNITSKVIPGMPSDMMMNSTFGRKLEGMNLIKPWLANAQVGYLGCKGRSWKTALREFKKLNEVKHYWIQCPDQTKYYKDDSIKIYYTTKG